MKPTTLAAALAAGATVILRGHGRAYAPGDTAFRLVERRSRFDPPGLVAYLAPVRWHNDEWRGPSDYRGPYAALNADELVSVVE